MSQNSKMSKKSESNENFINKLKHYILLRVKKLNDMIDFLRTHTQNDLVDMNNLTLSEQLRTWLIETFGYGLALSLIYNWFVGFQGWHNIYLWFILGLARWMIYDSIKLYREL